MKRKTSVFTLVVVLLGLSGCVAGSVLMRNDKGELVKCEAGTGAAIVGGYVGTKLQVNSCVKEYEAAGYTRITH